jgi:hypothetical protein
MVPNADAVRAEPQRDRKRGDGEARDQDRQDSQEWT